ncbi:choice-of-anchor D domain-containing protein [Vulgatibacter sp.]|uniref:choice-of-anchor D domain-containing protein n=1 Tax=Vulgatibacter sp. TaxID=1971226 RepID=UPI0035667E54
MRWLVVLIPILAACSCEEKISAAAGDVVATPQSLDFGGVFLGEEGEAEVVFRNDGRTHVTLSAAELPPNFLVKPANLEIAPGATANWTFIFVPEVVGAAAGEAKLEITGAKNKEILLPLQGVGLARDVIVEALDFGLVPIGEERTLPLEVKSGSEGVLSVEMTLTGSESSAYQINTSRLELGPNETTTVQVTFQPQVRGPHVARLLLKTCADCQEQSVRITGQGAVQELRPAPSSIDFGMVTPGNVKTRNLKVTNTGDLPVQIGRVGLLPEGGPDFHADATAFPMELAAGESVSFDVSFQPPQDAEYIEQANAVQFYAADANTPIFNVPVTGRPGGPNLGVFPELIDFGQQPVNLRVENVVTVRNFGEPAAVRIVAARLEGPGAAAYTLQMRRQIGEDAEEWIAPELGLPADVGDAVANFKVSFRGTAPGDYGAELVISTDDDEDPEFRIPVTGNARETGPCSLQVRPGTLRFGLVANGGEYTRSVNVQNTGVDDCLIWDVRLAANGSPFFVTAGVPTTTTLIPAGGSLPLAVRFIPQGLADVRQESTLSFAHSTPGTPRMEIPVSGLPSRYNLEVTPNPVMFGALPIDYRSNVNVTVSNVGSFAVNMVSGNKTTETSAEFGIQPALGVPGPLAEGGQAVYQVSYAPAEAGGDNGMFELWIQEATEPLLLDARGSGTDEECGELCAAPQAICPGAQTTNVNNQIVLAGSGSDPAGDSLNCTWRVASGPTGSRAAPDNAAQCVTTFTPDIVGDYVMELTVTDPMGNTGTCTADVHANPFGGLWVEMYWSPAGDMDLHMLHPNAGSGTQRASWTDSSYACFYANCVTSRGGTLAWDTSSVNDDPSLDRDDIPGTGPENIRINQPSTTHSYAVGFKNFSNSNTPITVTYNVYCGGALVNAANNTFTSTTVSEFIYVGDVQYASAAACTFTPNGTVIPP